METNPIACPPDVNEEDEEFFEKIVNARFGDQSQEN